LVATLHSPYYQPAAVGAFILFAELLLIRWLATEIRAFAYFKNLTLIACFLGMGLGCLAASRIGRRLVWVFPLLAGLGAVVIVPKSLGFDLFGIVNSFLAELSDMPLWVWSRKSTTVAGGGLALALLAVLFIVIAAVFVPPGEVLGTSMNACSNKYLAYASNIVGSLAGILLFEGVSYLSLPPVVWFALAALLGLALTIGRREMVATVAGAAVIAGLLLVQPNGAWTNLWSPYQKVTYTPLELTDSRGAVVKAGYRVRVNEAFHQNMLNFSPAFLNSHADIFPDAPIAGLLGYNTPYRFQPGAAEVLVVGAGTGNDVAAALRNGARHVDAVEIDPRILELGRRLHPERPYDDPRVHVVIDDARSFFKRTQRKYDLIVFGALDSHTLNSAMSNLRIDTYVYTVEAFREARACLRPRGIVWLLFAFEKGYIGDRLYGMLDAAFDAPPVGFYNQDIKLLSPAGGGGTFVADLEGHMAARVAASTLLSALVGPTRMAARGQVLLATDDWPYLYVRDRAIPTLYLIVMSVIVLIAAVSVRPFVGRLRRLDGHFFVLGAAFLLLEVQSISRMTLLFGNTWEVNAVVIGSVLIMALGANLCASRLGPQALRWLYLGLALSLLVSFQVRLSMLLSMTGPMRMVLAGLVTALPLFFGGMLFSRTFAGAKESNVALGSNLIGAIVGGTFESLSFVIGLNALLLIALSLYTASFLILFLRREIRLVRAVAGPG